MKPLVCSALALLTLAVPAPILAAATIYVDDDNTAGPWNGTPANPYQYIQDGIDNANPGDTVIVRDGTYTGALNKDLDFGGNDITLQSENGAASTIIDCENVGRGSYFGNGETWDAVVDGFTIRNGSASLGAGIYCGSSDPTIRNCVITGSSAAVSGGGIYCSSSKAIIRDCTITGNWTSGYGGGIGCTGGTPQIFRCTITDNWASGNGGGIAFDSVTSPVASVNECTITGNTGYTSGGGISFYSGSSPQVFYSTISGNDATYAGGGISCEFGSDPVISGSTISDNWVAFSGGGIACNGSSAAMEINRCTIRGNTAYLSGGGISFTNSSATVVDCKITGNSASDVVGEGGGIRCSQSSPTITNCTISGNWAEHYGGGIACLSGSSPTITNCILWGDSFPEVLVPTDSSAPTLNYCDIEGGWAGIGSGDNIEEDPLFVDPGYWNGEAWIVGDYHLLPGSPCIDSGFGDNGVTIPIIDIEGRPRIDDPHVLNTGTGTPDYVDMGAYERHPAWAIKGVADFNGDGRPGILWRHATTGEVGVWLMNGLTISSADGVATVPQAWGWAIKGVGDFDGDGRADILWRETVTGDVAIWLMNGITRSSAAVVQNVAAAWQIRGVGDFNNDGRDDIIWRNTGTGDVAIWLMNGTSISSTGVVATVVAAWEIHGVGDFNGDGRADVLWRNTGSGDVAIWLMNGTSIADAVVVKNAAAAHEIKDVGDFDGDGDDDILWRHSVSGDVAVWLMNGLNFQHGGVVATVDPTANDYEIRGVGDFDGDGRADILWRDVAMGDVAIWFMNGLTITTTGIPGTPFP